MIAPWATEIDRVKGHVPVLTIVPATMAEVMTCETCGDDCSRKNGSWSHG